MTDSEFRSQIKKAQKIVGTWPAWKQNILVHSSQSTNSSPRQPVNNTSKSNDQKLAHDGSTLNEVKSGRDTNTIRSNGT